jgi:peptidoglycan biosynthesis protein MviN/MurJ (putative lipid II flippase)
MGESIGRAVNVLLPFVILHIHSVDGRTDAFFLALAVAYFVHGTLGNVVASVQVIELVKDKDRRSLRHFGIWALGGGAIAASVVFLLGSHIWSVEGRLIAVAAVAISAASGLLAGPAAAVLNSDHRYLMPGLTWAFRVVPVATYFLWSPSSPELHWLLLGISLADALRAALLFTLCNGRLTFSELDRALGFPIDAIYLLLSTSIAGLTPLAARWIASLGDPGNVSIFDTADRIYGAVASLATIGMGSVVLVYLSRLNEHKGEEDRAWMWTVRSAVAWGGLWTTLSVLVWFGFPHAVQMFPVQTEQTVEEIRNTFLALSIGLPAFILGMVYSRKILILGFTRSLLPMALVGLACSAIAGFILFNRLGTAGIALAVAAGQYLVLGLMVRCVRSQRHHAHLDPL